MKPNLDLPKPSRRQLVHTRTYTGDAYEREDGLFDVEVEMRDTKPFSFDNTDRGYVAAGEPLHHMKMRVTLDESMEIVDVEARTLASPFHMCADITPNYKSLIGLRIVGGFSKKVQEVTGRTSGCTHLNDILRVLGTIAFQGVGAVLLRRQRERKKENNPSKDRHAPSKAGSGRSADIFMGTCHAYAPSSPIVERQWPELYVPKTKNEVA